MGQGRRWLAVFAVSFMTLVAAAGELPNAPSSEPATETLPALELRAASPPVIEPMAYVAQPIAIEKPAPRHKKVFDKKFAVLSALAAGLTVADFEMTQHCLARRTCVESDPLMPTSHAGMYATNIPLNAALFYWSYRRKQDGKRLWWLAPLMVVGSHAAGVGTNVPFVGK